jgi:predicted anti-sigma-YlaC factor YlaD
MIRSAGTTALLVFISLASSGCSIKKMAIGSLADTLASSGTVFASDDDPELIRDAVPFSLKTVESLLVEVPRHPGLLLSACSGFTQYAYAFIQTDAEITEPRDFSAAQAMRERARKMYLRALGYCISNLELRHPGIRDHLSQDPVAALKTATKGEVPVLYWSGAAWGSAIAIGLDHPELIADLPAARALMTKALELDEGYESGAIHSAMIAVEALPETMGGSPQRARAHFDRAVALSGGLSAGPYVSFAMSVDVPAQNRKEFESLINTALAIDVDKRPQWRLANLISQKRARDLLARIDELFVDSGAPTGGPLPVPALPVTKEYRP